VTQLPIELIKERREALGISQREAAERAGISRNEWNAMENGKRGVGPKNAPRFVAVLGGAAEDYLTTPVWPAIEELRRRVAELERRMDEQTRHIT
jgi:transcriptional regulator with XRE-family HTH domain